MLGVVVFVGLIALLGVASNAGAQVTTYLYQGNNFNDFLDLDPPAGSYDSSMRVTVSLTLAEPLGPGLNSFTPDILSFSFNDGRQTLTEADADARGADQ